MKRSRRFLLLLPWLLGSCVQPEAASGRAYFSLGDYFSSEATRLQQISPMVNKQVTVNGIGEGKRVRIADWKSELAVFSEADINKAAWRGAFRLQKTDSTDIYTSANPKISVRKVEIHKKADSINRVLIVTQTKNYLYRSADSLEYVPGKSYRISKRQNIRFLAPKQYTITGQF
ncbi:hypothetical protein C7T94_17815 [Pedobacter yulinensis]|uniref:Uncharacterized protein n=1 Tax=Pedobacter yulinensis TaxID=2126353 RepID=A0A2T3HH18_9SPHI|nr:hypothetical protein [Pedobacter yulinensis]PST81730.1 hypothetical protein C7T94_17815 [Pedobacter yulinensis]